jgi:hypothetical protein
MNLHSSFSRSTSIVTRTGGLVSTRHATRRGRCYHGLMVAPRGLGLAVVHVFAFSLLAVRVQAVELRLPSAEARLEVGDATDVCDIPSGSGHTSEVCQVLEPLISASPMFAGGIVTSGVFALVTNPVRKDLDAFSVFLQHQRVPGAGKWSEEDIAKYLRGVAEGSHGTTTSLGVVRINGFPVLKLHFRSMDATEGGLLFTFVRRESLVSLQVTGPVAQSAAVETYAEAIAHSLKMPNDASKDFGGRRASAEPRSGESGCCAKKKLVFTTGHGEANPATELQVLMAKLERRFETVTVDPSSQAIGADVAVVVVGGPRQRFDEKGLRELDRAIRSARGAVILAPGAHYVPPRIDGGGTQYGRLQAIPTGSRSCSRGTASVSVPRWSRTGTMLRRGSWRTARAGPSSSTFPRSSASTRTLQLASVSSGLAESSRLPARWIS